MDMWLNLGKKKDIISVEVYCRKGVEGVIGVFSE